jgi:branched-chain amino acid transport system substrate-binding protein
LSRRWRISCPPHTFQTVAGPITFGENGERTEPRVMEIQFRSVKGNDFEQLKDPEVEVVRYPPSVN